MTGQFTKCDYCKLEHRDERAPSQSHYFMPHGWLKLARWQSQGTDVIMAGAYHFCSEACLAAWIKEPR